MLDIAFSLPVSYPPPGFYNLWVIVLGENGLGPGVIPWEHINRDFVLAAGNCHHIPGALAIIPLAVKFSIMSAADDMFSNLSLKNGHKAKKSQSSMANPLGVNNNLI
jgi:hypothetical protein